MTLVDYIVVNRFNTCGNLIPYPGNKNTWVILETIKSCTSWDKPPIVLEDKNRFYFLGRSSDISELGSELNHVGMGIKITDLWERSPEFRDVMEGDDI
jgi:hypothetical protein